MEHDKQNHILLGDEPAWRKFLPEVRGFLATVEERQSSSKGVAGAVDFEQPDLRTPAAPDGTVTIVFSDIEGSTAMTERLGDRRMQEVLLAHNTIVRKQVTAFGGFEVKSIGDGFMLAFSSARRALKCAIAIQVSFAEYNDENKDEPLKVRIGLHTGEALRDANDFHGKHVILAARIAGQATGGEILVSSLLKELTESAGDIQFGEWREVELKGLAGLNQLYAVNWNSASGLQSSTTETTTRLHRNGCGLPQGLLTASQEVEALIMERTQVLVVEDEAVVAMDIQSKLEDLGYSVIAVIRSGEEAVQTACEMRPDLILMDITLQGDMDGISAVACIQKSNATPVVYMTAHGDKATLERAKETEPFGYIIKPIEEQALRAAIEVALNKHRLVATREAEQREHAKEAVRERTVELAQRHRELSALNTAFQKHLKVRDEETRTTQELRQHVKDVVNRVQGLLDYLSKRIEDESIDIGPLLNLDHGIDISESDEETSSEERHGQGMIVSQAGRPPSGT